MKPFFDVMFDRTGSLILLAAYILVLGQILICLEIIHLRPYVHAAIISFTHFAVGFAILMLLETGHWEVTWDGRMNGSYGPFVQFFLDVPWLVYALLELVSLLMLVFSGVQLRLFVGRHVTTASIKSAIDLLPSGICFADSDGITLSNRRISTIAQDITGEPLTEVHRFLRLLAEHGEEHSGKLMAHAQSGTVWLFDRRLVTVDGRACDQIVASDVTELTRITDELAEKNRRLRDVQVRMSAFRVRETDIFISREIMTARSIVHDHMGNVLLLGRYYLDHPESTDEATLLQTMEAANHFLLGEVESPDDIHDPYDYALKMARSIGITVELEGDIPTAETPRALLGQLIRECATNAYKHAEATEIRVNITEEIGILTCTVRNNGRAPESPIRASGGLLSLTRMAEEAGGTLTIRSKPEFLLTLTIPADAKIRVPSME